MRNDTWQIIIGKPEGNKYWHIHMGPVSEFTSLSYIADLHFKTVKQARIYIDKIYNVTWVNNKKAYLVTSSLEID